MTFKYSYSLDGSDPIIQSFPAVNADVFSVGEFALLASGEAGVGVTNSDAYIGATVEACDNTADGEQVRVIINRWAVYEVVDANARTIDDPLDLGTGGLTVAATSNADLRVVRTSTASEPTHVVVNTGHHFLDVVAS